MRYIRSIPYLPNAYTVLHSHVGIDVYANTIQMQNILTTTSVAKGTPQPDLSQWTPLLSMRLHALLTLETHSQQHRETASQSKQVKSTKPPSQASSKPRITTSEAIPRLFTRVKTLHTARLHHILQTQLNPSPRTVHTTLP